MKLVKIFGMVLALHLVLLTVFFLSPGCQSTPKEPPAEVSAEPVMPVVPASENWSSQPSTASSGGSYSSLSSTTSTAPLTGLTPAERARLSPTRPDDPSAYIATGAQQPVALGSGTPPPPPAPTTYTVMAGDSLWKIARKFGTNVPELMKVNAGLKADALKPGDIVKLPAGASVASIPQSGSTTTTQAVTSAAATSTYVVKSGDSLSKIAARNGTTVAALRSANDLTSDMIQIGQKLVIPSATGAAPSAPSGEAATAAPGEGITIVVQSGETLGEIARRFDVTVQQLMQANNITDSRRVRAGQRLVIPGYESLGGAPITTPSAPTTTRRTAPPPVTTTPPSGTSPTSTTPPVETPAPVDLDTLVPADTPVVPIDEPVPTP